MTRLIITPYLLDLNVFNKYPKKIPLKMNSSGKAAAVPINKASQKRSGLKILNNIELINKIMSRLTVRLENIILKYLGTGKIKPSIAARNNSNTLNAASFNMTPSLKSPVGTLFTSPTTKSPP